MAKNTYVAIANQTLTSNATSVTFSNISQEFTDLIIIVSAYSNGNDFISVRLNSDTGNNYSHTNFYYDVPTSEAGNAAYANLWRLGSSATPTNKGITTINLMSYSDTNKNKSIIARNNNAERSASPSLTKAYWRSKSAVSTIQISPNLFDGTTQFVSGSTFTIYGISAAPVVSAKATGGTIVYAADGYTYHTFTSTGTFTPSQNLDIEALVIAGGGSGGTSVGGGGGGGGLVALTTSLASATGYTVTVGAGGASVGSNSRGNNGSNSQFGSLTAAVGGGGGGSYAAGAAGKDGGSGGGAGGWSPTALGGAATAGQGYAGGNVTGGTYNAGGSAAGGGAGGVGASYSSGTVGAIGGPGSSTYSSWAFATGTGVTYGTSRYFAAGGPGVYGLGGTQATAAYGSLAFVNSAGTANTGQGGVGDYGTAGGSGVVIVRYLS